MPYEQDDTIVALATAPGRAGVAIVRVSGPGAWAIGAKIAGLPAAPRSLAGTFRHVRFRARGGEVADDGVILFFAAPRSPPPTRSKRSFACTIWK